MYVSMAIKLFLRLKDEDEDAWKDGGEGTSISINDIALRALGPSLLP
jgi:hypothetical protein